MIIQIIGLPGSGKTTLAEKLVNRINAIHLNADAVRATINSDLGFSPEDRVEHSRRLGAMARLLSDQGLDVVVDFVCPTESTRSAFGKPNICIWMDTIQEGRFEDTNKLWEEPTEFNHRFTSYDSEAQATLVMAVNGLHDWKAPTTLMLGRYQPWHEGHHALYDAATERTPQVMIGVRNTQGTSEKDPLSFAEVKGYIEEDEHLFNPMVVKMPNITNIVYGRDVGYKIEQVKLGEEIEAISATQKRSEMGI